MRNNHTQLVVILDRSGSMDMIAQSTIDAYNELIKQQKAVPGTANIMLAQFDDIYEVLYNEELSKAPLLDRTTFVPRGMTALHDAIGNSIVTVGQTLANLPEDERPDKVIVAIFTDGGENSSREYTKESVAALIKEQKEKYSWQFNFFGANQDAVLTAKGLNINANNAYTFSSDPNAVRNTMAFAGTYMASTRTAVGTNASEFVMPDSYTKAFRSASMSNKVVSQEEIDELAKAAV